MYKDVSTFFSYFCSFFINTTARNLNWKYKFYSPCHQILKQLALSSRQVEKIKYLNTLRNAIKNSCELKSAFWKCVVFIFHPVGQTEVLDIKNGHKRIILKLQSLCDRQEPREKKTCGRLMAALTPRVGAHGCCCAEKNEPVPLRRLQGRKWKLSLCL